MLLIVLFNGMVFVFMKGLKFSVDYSYVYIYFLEEFEGLYCESVVGGLIDVEECDMLVGVLNVENWIVCEIMSVWMKLFIVLVNVLVVDVLWSLVGSFYFCFLVM